MPSSETPAPGSWVVKPYSNSHYGTFGAWERTFPVYVDPNGNSFLRYPGRFVYEQTGPAGATDTCYSNNALNPTSKVTGVTGGGWFVNPNNVWEWDDIGMWSQGIDWYKANVTIPCYFTVAQDMYIDGRTGPAYYTTNQLTFEIDPTEIWSEVQPKSGAVVKECEYYPISRRTCRP